MTSQLNAHDCGSTLRGDGHSPRSLWRCAWAVLSRTGLRRRALAAGSFAALGLWLTHRLAATHTLLVASASCGISLGTHELRSPTVRMSSALSRTCLQRHARAAGISCRVFVGVHELAARLHMLAASRPRHQAVGALSLMVCATSQLSCTCLHWHACGDRHMPQGL